MSTQDLLDAFRGLVGDTRPLYYYSDALLLTYFNEAQREACRRARLIIDSLTPDLAVFAVVPNQQTVTLDPRIIFIRDVRLASRADPLWRVKYRDLDLHAPGWLTQEASYTSHYCVDYQQDQLYFHTKIVTADTVTLTVCREPLEKMTLPDPLEPLVVPGVSPEIAPRYQEKLTHWVAYRALNRSDLEDKFDPKRAAEEYKLFQDEFGPPSRAIDEVWIHREHGSDLFDGTY